MAVKSTLTPDLLRHLGSLVQPSLKRSKVWLTRVATQVCRSSCSQIQQVIIATAKNEQDAHASADLFLTLSPAARSGFEVWHMSDYLCFLPCATGRLCTAEVLLRCYRGGSRMGDPSFESIFMICFPFFLHYIFFSWLLCFLRKLVHHSPAMR